MTKSMREDREQSPQFVPHSLPGFLCFAVYTTNLAFSRAYRPLLEQHGLTYPQFLALVALSEEDRQTVGQLGKKLFLESSTLTPLLKRLEATGFVTRHRDDEDERQVRIALTAKGRSAYEAIFLRCSTLVQATGLDQEHYVRMQAELITLRDTLLGADK